MNIELFTIILLSSLMLFSVIMFSVWVTDGSANLIFKYLTLVNTIILLLCMPHLIFDNINMIIDPYVPICVNTVLMFTLSLAWSKSNILNILFKITSMLLSFTSLFWLLAVQ